MPSMRGENALVIHMIDGQEVVFVLSGSPKLEINGNTVEVTTSNGELVAYNLSELDRFTLDDVDMDGFQAPKSPILYNSTNEGLRVSGLSTGEVIHIYDTIGRLYSTARVPPNGSVTFSLPHGLYTIKSRNYVFKFLKQ